MNPAEEVVQKNERALLKILQFRVRRAFKRRVHLSSLEIEQYMKDSEFVNNFEEKV